MTIITDYLSFQLQYQQQYGPKTILLMQIGNFYEIYGYDPKYCLTEEAKIDKDGKNWPDKIGFAQECSVILNCVLAYENSNEPYSIKNPHKVGFPCIAYEKNKTTILANDYVLVRMDQAKNGKSVSRFVAEVCSPALELDNITAIKTTNNIISIYIEYQQSREIQKYENYMLTIGISCLDIITGQNFIGEFYSKIDDEINALQELYRFLIAHYPKEILLYLNDLPSSINPDNYLKYLEQNLELVRYDRVISKINSIPKDYLKIHYQDQIFLKLFNQSISNLGLERINYGRIAYVILVNHCNAHNSKIFAKLSAPNLNWLDASTHLILAHNAIVQLNVLPFDSNISLFSLLDENLTLLGKRLLEKNLRAPTTDINKLNNYYNMIEEMLSNKIQEESLWAHLEKYLKDLPDLARLQRKLAMKIITPRELAVLYKGYLTTINLYCIIISTPCKILHQHLMPKNQIENFNLFMAQYTQLINFTALECCVINNDNGKYWMDFTEWPIKGVPDSKILYLNHLEQQLNGIIDHLNKCANIKLTLKQGKKGQGAKKNEPTELILTLSNAKANILSQTTYDKSLCGELLIQPYTTNEKLITSSIINTLSQNIDQCKNELRIYLANWYQEQLNMMNENYTFYKYILKMIGLIDLIHSYAKVSYKYNYYRPKLENGSHSKIKATNLRHPLIERIIDGEYISNDINLNGNGMLLFGLNQVGKSSLAKSLGLNVIMAQIGCFTAGQIELVPYKKIITRLNGMDNLFQGQSSFAVEMCELRTILRQNDEYTLVIGDEIAHTSDSTSGTALTASAVLSLCKTKASFLFASHAHDVLELPAIKELKEEQVRICHLSTTRDEKTNSLVYNRKLQAGSGEKVYGILVAETLNLPKEFISQAYQMLKFLEGKHQELIALKKSKYNVKVYMSECEKCGVSSLEKELHTHHIKEQNLADEKGMFEGTSKNVKENLRVLCRECHLKEHN